MFAGAATAPYITALGRHTLERIRGQRMEDVHRALADEGVTPEQLKQAVVGDERVIDLYEAAVLAALRSSSHRKRRTLGRALATGVLKEKGWAREYELRILRGIESVEEHDLLVLDHIAGQPEHEVIIPRAREPVRIDAGSAEYYEMKAAFDEEILDFVIENLENSGLVDSSGTHFAGAPYVWVVTRLGRAVLAAFHEDDDVALPNAENGP